ncbi:MAG: hypothetical protein M5U26_04275 [Planctomycetota bacterium]|nr:hypothetical protein [Planctomycetota bacterium]
MKTAASGVTSAPARRASSRVRSTSTGALSPYASACFAASASVVSGSA